MKKLTLLSICMLWALCAGAQSTTLAEMLPLLQAPTRTTEQNRQVLQVFISSKQPDIIFAAGASLVRIPPAAGQETRLVNLLMRNSLPLQKVFASIILIAMGDTDPALSPTLQEAIDSQDPVLRAYAASAYTILNPQNTAYREEIVQLYIYDPAFAQRAMNLTSSSEKQTFQILKAAAQSERAPVRAAAATWLGDLQTQKAAAYLLKMAKRETDDQVIAAIARSLAQNRTWTLPALTSLLKTNYTHSSTATYSLALGFMTGNAVDTIKQGLAQTNPNIKINAARSAAYMAHVLASPDAARYSTDPVFDAHLLKALLLQLTVLSSSSNLAVQKYAQNAVQQIAKLK